MPARTAVTVFLSVWLPRLQHMSLILRDMPNFRNMQMQAIRGSMAARFARTGASLSCTHVEGARTQSCAATFWCIAAARLTPAFGPAWACVCAWAFYADRPYEPHARACAQLSLAQAWVTGIDA